MFLSHVICLEKQRGNGIAIISNVFVCVCVNTWNYVIKLYHRYHDGYHDYANCAIYNKIYSI